MSSRSKPSWTSLLRRQLPLARQLCARRRTGRLLPRTRHHPDLLLQSPMHPSLLVRGKGCKRALHPWDPGKPQWPAIEKIRNEIDDLAKQVRSRHDNKGSGCICIQARGAPADPSDGRLCTSVHADRSVESGIQNVELGLCMQAAEMEQQFGNSGALSSNKAAALTEMLTQKLLALDNVDTLGDQELRQERKAEINKINRLLDHLEAMKSRR